MLNAHFAQHPDQRTAFEQMLAVDLALKEAEPVAPPPADFAQRVMAQARVTKIAVPPFRRRHVAVIVVGHSLIVASTWAVPIGLLVALAVLLARLPILQPLFAFGRAVSLSFADVLRLLGAVARGVAGQPLAWLALIVAFGMMAVWFAVVARVWLPRRNWPTCNVEHQAFVIPSRKKAEPQAV